MKIEIPFSEVLDGEKFVSRKSKRAFTGIKIKTAHTIADGKSFHARAVIIADDRGERVESSGVLIGFDPDRLVEVERK